MPEPPDPILMPLRGLRVTLPAELDTADVTFPIDPAGMAHLEAVTAIAGTTCEARLRALRLVATDGVDAEYTPILVVDTPYGEAHVVEEAWRMPVEAAVAFAGHMATALDLTGALARLLELVGRRVTVDVQTHGLLHCIAIGVLDRGAEPVPDVAAAYRARGITETLLHFSLRIGTEVSGGFVLPLERFAWAHASADGDGLVIALFERGDEVLIGVRLAGAGRVA